MYAVALHPLFFQSDTAATIIIAACLCAATIIIAACFVCGYYSRQLLHIHVFEGGYYSRVGGFYSRVATIRGWLLFEGGYYLRVAFISCKFGYCKQAKKR